MDSEIGLRAILVKPVNLVMLPQMDADGRGLNRRDRKVLVIHWMIFFVITPLTGLNSPLRNSNLSLISDFVDTIG